MGKQVVLTVIFTLVIALILLLFKYLALLNAVQQQAEEKLLYEQQLDSLSVVIALDSAQISVLQDKTRSLIFKLSKKTKQNEKLIASYKSISVDSIGLDSIYIRRANLIRQFKNRDTTNIRRE